MQNFKFDDVMDLAVQLINMIKWKKRKRRRRRRKRGGGGGGGGGGRKEEKKKKKWKIMFRCISHISFLNTVFIGKFAIFCMLKNIDVSRKVNKLKRKVKPEC